RTERSRRLILVQRATAHESPATIGDEIAKCRNAAAVGALEVPRRAALTIERHGQHLLIREELLVRLAIDGRVRQIVAVLERDLALMLGGRPCQPERDCSRLIEARIPVRLEVELDRRELGRRVHMRAVVARTRGARAGARGWWR